MAKGKKAKTRSKQSEPEAPVEETPLVANPPRPNWWLLIASASLLAAWLLYLFVVAIWVAIRG